MGLSEAILANLTAGGDRRAVEENGIWHSWGEVARIALALDRKLVDLGIPRGRPVGLVARNSFAHIVALYGLLATHRTTVMLYSALPPETLAAEIEKLSLPAVIADAIDWDDRVLQAATACGTVALEVGADDEAPITVLNVHSVPYRARAYAETPAAIEMLSSGTTGLPKRIPILWSTLEQMAEDAIINFTESGQGDNGEGPAPLIQPAPLANISGLYGVVPAGIEGRPLSLISKFDVDGWVRTVQRVRPRVSWLPPAAIQSIWNDNVSVEALSSLVSIRTGSAPLDPELQQRFEERYGLKILLMYGFTESCGTIVMWTLADRDKYAGTKNGSVGRPRPGVQLRVVDPATGELCDEGEMGVLEAQVLRISPDWIRTTDLARIDTDGFLYLSGRADDVINRGGFKVLPEMVVETLQRHEAVAAAAVVGVADERLGEVPVAAVELRAGYSADADELAAYCRRVLTPYQVPARFLIVDQLPRTQTMKIDRPAVRELLRRSPQAVAPRVKA